MSPFRLSQTLRRTAEKMAAGEMLKLDGYHSKQNNVLTAWCEFDSFECIRVGHGIDTAFSSAYVNVYPDRIELFNNTFEPLHRATWQHRLCIKDYLLVVIEVTRCSMAKIRISTSTGVFETAETDFRGCGTECYMLPIGQNVVNAKLTYADNDKNQPVWLFGDSYMDMYPRYLIEAGFGATAIDGHSGRNSQAALASLKHALKYCRAPQYLIWALGMNDADTETAANEDWLKVSKELLQICSEYRITPILCTTPDTPSRLNRFKNAYVFKSGCRVCDIASAVQRAGQREWYEGLLREDLVHPTEKGSQLIAMKMIAEIPEIQERF